MTSNYRMPAEWEPHASTILAWPHNKEDWPRKFEPVPWVMAEIVRYLTQVERVRLLVRGKRQKQQARDYCQRVGVDLNKVDMYTVPTNRIWMRDLGPIFVRSGNKKIMLDWRFNAWAKYRDYVFDDRVPLRVSQHLKNERIQPLNKGRRIVLEGGAIDVNGKGTLLTTEECLLSRIQRRNANFTRETYEQVFAEWLGIRQVIWLDNGIAGDDTHGHVDDISRFANANTVVTVVENDKRDDNHAPLKENLKRLKAARDQNGKPLTVVELPMPRPLIFEGRRLPASYANFYIANGLVLMPTFNDPADRIALQLLAEVFPKHTVVGIHSVDLVWGFGTLHCLSQQEPL